MWLFSREEKWMLKEELEYRILELSEHLPHSRGIALPEVDGYSERDILEHIESLVERKLILAKGRDNPASITWLVQGLTAAGHRELKFRRLAKRQTDGRIIQINWRWGICFAIPAATAIAAALYLGTE
jgi:hypothetical protein